MDQQAISLQTTLCKALVSNALLIVAQGAQTDGRVGTAPQPIHPLSAPPSVHPLEICHPLGICHPLSAENLAPSKPHPHPLRICRPLNPDRPQSRIATVARREVAGMNDLGTVRHGSYHQTRLSCGLEFLLFRDSSRGG